MPNRLPSHRLKVAAVREAKTKETKRREAKKENEIEIHASGSESIIIGDQVEVLKYYDI